MATTMGARGTRQYSSKSTRSGSNNSVQSNRTSSQPAKGPARPSASYRAGSFNRGAVASAGVRVRSAQTGKTMGTVKATAYNKGANTFRAPSSMPSKLNNTAAAAVSRRRYVSSAAAAAVLAPSGPIGLGLIGGFTATAITRGGARNNYASIRLKAAGYRVKGTGYKGIVTKNSKRSQRRAQGKIKRIEMKNKARGTSRRYIANGAKQGNRSLNVVVKTSTNRRYRRDSKGRYAGSY